MNATPDGDGKRVRFESEGERYYLIATRAADGGIDFIVTCPDENKAVGLHRRLTAEAICRVCSQLTREV